MAEGEGNVSQQRVVSLLQEATRMIREYPGSSNDVSSAQVANPNVISQSESHATTSSAVNTSNSERVLGNFRNLFALYGHTGRRCLSSSTLLFPNEYVYNTYISVLLTLLAFDFGHGGITISR
ncbi:Hypothetical predicted protein [Paramuricea clavata]|uniref:Uncharacterized protein n=1 Tax=Paramuricea clavata TaxID=317549 RepID=A0A6S7ITY0_PARCT|nr:Hypothetical predicted protein [Paramuricea clavata]